MIIEKRSNNDPEEHRLTKPDSGATANASRRHAQRARSLRAMVSHASDVRCETTKSGLTLLAREVTRPRRLKTLRVLGGMAPGPSTTVKSVELDLIGDFFWKESARNMRVCDLIESVRRRFLISYREAEVSVTEYVRALGARGLITVTLPRDVQ